MCYTWHLRSRSPGLVYNRVKVPVPKVLPMATHVAVFPEPPFSHAYCGPQNQAASPGLKPRYMYGWAGGRKGWGSVRSITWAGKSRNVKKNFSAKWPRLCSPKTCNTYNINLTCHRSKENHLKFGQDPTPPRK
jgi:hypothetical protein